MMVTLGLCVLGAQAMLSSWKDPAPLVVAEVAVLMLLRKELLKCESVRYAHGRQCHGLCSLCM